MKQKTYSVARDFLDSFTTPLDCDKLKQQVDYLSKIVCEDYGIGDKFLRCDFEEDKKFGKTASVSDTKITINSLRLDALCHLAFDDTHPEELKQQIKNFMNSYNDKAEHSIYEKMLHQFVCDMKEIGQEHLVLQAGSHKTIKYNFLDIVFHENRHIVQKEYIPLLKESKSKLKGKDPILLFTMLYNEMYYALIDSKKIEWEYQDNSTFPIELDARYISLVNLNALRKLYFEDDKLFASYIASSCLVQQDQDSKKAAKDLFLQLEKYYSLDDFSKYSASFDLVEKHKAEITKALASRLDEMKQIVKENKEISLRSKEYNPDEEK